MGEFVTIKNGAVGKEMDELIRTGENGEIAYDTDILNDEFRALGTSHQPLIIACDNSGSTAADAGNGSSKLEMCCKYINGLRTCDTFAKLSAVDLNRIDVMTLSFEGSNVVLQSPWCPMSMYEGITELQPGGGTPLYKTMIEMVNASRVIRHRYAEQGIECNRPQAFIFTDGAATDMTMREEAKALLREYASKEGGKIKIFVVLVPGAMSEASVKQVTLDLIDLCDNITIIKAEDCVNGIPAAFEALASSVVVGASSSVGTEMIATYDPTILKVAKNTHVSDGQMSIGTQTPVDEELFN